MRTIKRFFTTLFALCLAAPLLTAIPARPGKFTYTQPDGTTIELRRLGDEYMHITVDAAGNTVRMESDGFYRPVLHDYDVMRRRARAKRTEAGRNRAKAAANTDLNQGERHILVLVASFRDVSFTISDPKGKFDALLNTRGYSYNGATGSVRDYYEENSDGLFKPIFDVYGPVQLTGNMATYGGNDASGEDKAPELAVFQAAKALDSQIDFSSYDYDGDGSVDMILFYYAGYNEAEGGSEDSIWPHQWSVQLSTNTTIRNNNSFDGVKLGKYFCTSELDMASGSTFCGIGTTCHEFAHSLGLPDFYDTDYGDSGTTFGENHGCAADPYSYSLMSSGPYNNNGRTPPYLSLLERIMLGWKAEGSYRDFPATGNYVIPPVQDGIAYKTDTGTSGEYFLYECRGESGWDAYLPGGPGLIVYHLDKSKTKVSVYDSYGYATNITAEELWTDWGSTNQINENAKHPCYYIVPALELGRIAYECDAEGYPYYFEETQIPFGVSAKGREYAPVDWNGNTGDIRFSSIQYSGGSVSLYATVPTEALDYCVIDNPGKGVYAAGAEFPLTLVASETRIPASVDWYFDGEPVYGGSVVLRAGEHSIEARITLTGGSLKSVNLDIVAR
ncbi:MAG: M6 family metalloprotease domain-containing protein [Bacteroidales bacterium]|nr:M6 family metalloprotease domain-containing protein [Bacteroidales bacterium]